MGVYLQRVHVWLCKLDTEQLVIMALNISLPLHATLAPTEGMPSPSTRKMPFIFLF